MDEKKIIDGIKFKKVDTATFTIDGEKVQSTFTKEDIDKLSKDGLLTIDINVKPNTDIETSKENISIKTFETIESTDNIDLNSNEYSTSNVKNNKTMLIAISTVTILLIAILFLFK